METIDDDRPKPTAEVPLLDGTRLKLVTALKKDQSYYELTLLFPDLTSEARKLPAWMYGFRKRNMTVEYLSRVGGQDPTMWDILHTIPRDALASVALGTVAYDMSKVAGRPRLYEYTSMVGVYAIGLAVKQRQGKWLTANELKRVVRVMEQYMTGYHAFEKHRGKPKTAAEVTLHDIVRKVDNAFGTHDDSCRYVKFIETASKAVHVEELVRSLQKRIHRSLAEDPTGKIPMIQTPIYIVCSITLQDRMPQHSINTNLSQSNVSYTFTVSVMRMLGYEQSSQVMCVTSLWSPG